ncbi:glycerol-3-phosphate dehydrogenase/oxidase [soil metagenome]
MTEHHADEAISPFSAATRAAHWATIQDQDLDLLVVGAGITGAGIALDAAGRGLRVAVVDAGDFGIGTSSRSSRLIHGGLRYLETFDFRLVFEALGERRRLLALAPHLVRPLPFLFPVHRGSGPNRLKLGAGMWLYDTLSLFRGIGRHHMLDTEGALEREPRLKTAGLRGGAIYFDAQVDDARLTVAVARAAHEGGAIALPYTRVVGFPKSPQGKITGVRLRDELSGVEKEVGARLILTAAGPWTDQVRRLADPAAEPRLRRTKGVHIVLPADRVGNEGAIIFPSPVDGRIMFILPWGEFTYVGTTDTDFDGDVQEPVVDAADVEYLLTSVNGLFPEAGLKADEVVSAWAGIRPLLAPVRSGRSLTPGRTSREHEIWREPSGLLCVAGGKLTTYRTMAAEATKRAARLLRDEHGVESGDFYTEHVRLPGSPEDDWEEFLPAFRSRAAAVGLSDDTSIHLARTYGEEADQVLSLISNDPSLAHPIDIRLPHVLAEIDHVVANEMPLTLDDLMRRRIHLFYELPDATAETAAMVARQMSANPSLGWDEQEVQRQCRSYLETRDAVMAFRRA